MTDQLTGLISLGITIHTIQKCHFGLNRFVKALKGKFDEKFLITKNSNINKKASQ